MLDMLNKVRNRVLPIVVALGAAVGIDPHMSPERVAASLLVLVAGVLMPSPWERIVRNSLRSIVDAWDKHAAEREARHTPPTGARALPAATAATAELVVAVERARRISAPPPHKNGSTKKPE